MSGRRRRWVFATGGAAALFLAVLVLLPVAMRWAAVSWLQREGHVRAEIEDVDFNPFTGRLTVSSLAGQEGEGSRLAAGMTIARVDWWPFFQRRIQISAVSLENAVVDVRIHADGSITVGRIAFRGGKDAGAETPGTWGVGVGAVDLRDVRLRLRDPRLTSDIVIQRLHIDPLRTWEAENPTAFSAELDVNGGRVVIEGDGTPFGDLPAVQVRFSVRDYRLGWVRPVVEALGLEDVGGTLGIDGDLRVGLESDPDRVKIGFEGSVTVENLTLALADGGGGLDAASAAVTGKTDAELRGDDGILVNFDGGISIRGAAGTRGQKESLSLGQIAAKTRLALHTGGVEDVVRAEGTASVEQLAAEVFADSVAEPPGGRDLLRQLRFDGDVSWEDLEVRFPAVTSGIDPGDDASEAPRRAEPVDFRAGLIGVDEGGSLTVHDEGVHPPLELAVSSLFIQVSGLDTASRDATTRVTARGRVGAYGALDVEAHGTPFGALEDGGMTARLEKIELAPFTGYAERYLGYRVRSGALDLGSDAQVEKGALRAENRIELHKFALERLDSTERGELESELGLPLDTALGLLRDKDKGIRLSIPVEGDLRDPSIGVGDAVRKALVNGSVKAIQSASLTYFAPVLASFAAPVGVALAAGKLVSLAMALRFEPVRFAPGSPELDAEALAYLDRLGDLLAERPAVGITICGRSVPADAEALRSGGDKDPGSKAAPVRSEETKKDDGKGREAPPAVSAETLRGLAGQRQARVKDYLVVEAGIDHGRLFVCDPEVVTDPTGSPVVTLSL